MDRYIKVTGRSRLSLAPDTTVLNMNISGECSDYRETIKMASEKTASVKAIFTGLGFCIATFICNDIFIQINVVEFRFELGKC